VSAIVLLQREQYGKILSRLDRSSLGLKFDDIRRGLYEQEQNRVISSVKESVEEAGQKSEYYAYYFIVGVSLAIFAGLILSMANLKSRQNQLDSYKQKIQNDVNVLNGPD